MPSRSDIIPHVHKNKAVLLRLPEAAESAVKAGSGPALGTYGRLVSSLPELAPFDLGLRAGLALVERFRLQSAARRLLPLEGVAGCLRRRQGGKEFVEVWHLPEVGRAKYGGLQTCSSVAMCPVCAAKISERRRIEVAEAIDAWEAAGGDVVMLTLTVRHTAGDAFGPLLDGLKGALKRVYQGSEGQKFKRWGMVGSIGSTETTWGEGSGFHPHIHQLLFVEKTCPFDLLLMHFRKQWSSALRLEGMRTVTEAGVDMSFNKQHRAEYVNKIGGWDLEHELAKGPVKKGREGRYSPLQLLASFADFMLTGDADHPGREHGRIWQTYALTMKGRHHLQWSRGLRALLGLGKAKTDEELAEEKDALGVLLAQLDRKQWATVLHFDARAELLNVAASGDVQAVEYWLLDLDLQWLGDEKQERRVKLSTSDQRTEWDDQREAEAEDLGLTRSEYLRWRHGGIHAMATPGDVLVQEKTAVVVKSGSWVRYLPLESVQSLRHHSPRSSPVGAAKNRQTIVCLER